MLSITSVKLTRISKIRGYRIFSDFSWPTGLSDFAQFNLIYGWNGCGKTTLSGLLRKAERKEPLTAADGDADFLFDATTIRGAEFAAASLPPIRVFNREFVEASVSASLGGMTPIFYFGEHSIEKQKQIEILKTEQKAKNEEALSLKGKKEEAEAGYERFCSDQAALIKTLLSSSGTNSYNNYDKRPFKATCAAISKSDPKSKLRTDEQKAALRLKKDSQAQDSIKALSIVLPNLSELETAVSQLLKKTVVSQVIDELSKAPVVAEWVKEGLALHTGEHDSKTCKFCDQALPKERIKKLEDHFNDEYQELIGSIESEEQRCRKIVEDLEKISIPGKQSFYAHLREDVQAPTTKLNKYKAGAVAIVNSLSAALANKRTKPFEAMALALSEGEGTPDAKEAAQAIDELNRVVKKHNEQCENFTKSVADARRELEECHVAEVLTEYDGKNEVIQKASLALTEAEKKARELGDNIAKLEEQISEFIKPADELTRELGSYLGRTELKFEANASGYTIARYGLPASHLSEGEKTAIAFLYFLKSLQDKSFPLASGVVVIDDPISSLDTNSIFCAFGFMKDRTKDAGQLIILTHNFAFFRQVKNWFNHLPHQGKKDISKQPARFYMLEATADGSSRNAELSVLDPLLHEYESEYHYLFKRVYVEANSSVKRASLEAYYGMPNIARRLLEAFLSFRFPAQAEGLSNQLDNVAFDAAKKSRILRFLHTYSHDGKIAEAEHDLSILAETPQVLKEVLELIASEDAKHYAEMLKLMPTP